MQNFTENLNIIQALDDLPNAVGGLTADQLKAKFDEGCNIIKNWINNTMIPAMRSTTAGSSGASDIGISPVVGLSGYTNVQDAIEGLMDAFTTGTVPDGSVTEAKLANSAVTPDKIAYHAVTTPKIDSGAVTSDKLGNGSVSDAKCDFSGGLHVGALVTSGSIVLNSNVYGNSLPQTATAGRLFFLKVQ